MSPHRRLRISWCMPWSYPHLPASTCRVGEAERQLRLLFEEAARCAPSIIFFDEIDGLAPVRSAKQVGVRCKGRLGVGRSASHVLHCHGSCAYVWGQLTLGIAQGSAAAQHYAVLLGISYACRP
jgi:hypothetical protein